MYEPENEKKDYNPNIERERLLNEIKRDAEREAERKRKEAEKEKNCKNGC